MPNEPRGPRVFFYICAVLACCVMILNSLEEEAPLAFVCWVVLLFLNCLGFVRAWDTLPED